MEAEAAPQLATRPLVEALPRQTGSPSKKRLPSLIAAESELSNACSVRAPPLRDQLRQPRQPRWHVLRTVTQTSPSFTSTPVGGYGIGIRLASLVFGSIRHSARSRGVVAQM